MNKITGGTQFKNSAGKTHYEANKAYYLNRNKIRKQEMFRKINEYKSNLSCIDCGNKNPIVFEFDHIEDNKIAAVSAMVTKGYAWCKILDEIAKCECVCANCHRIRTYNRRNKLC